MAEKGAIKYVGMGMCEGGKGGRGEGGQLKWEEGEGAMKYVRRERGH